MNGLLGGGLGVFGVWLSVLIFVFLFVWAILWFLLPFAIFGTKAKLAALIAESQKTNVELARIAADLAAARIDFARQQPQQPIARDA